MGYGIVVKSFTSINVFMVYPSSQLSQFRAIICKHGNECCVSTWTQVVRHVPPVSGYRDTTIHVYSKTNLCA